MLSITVGLQGGIGVNQAFEPRETQLEAVKSMVPNMGSVAP